MCGVVCTEGSPDPSVSRCGGSKKPVKMLVLTGTGAVCSRRCWHDVMEHSTERSEVDAEWRRAHGGVSGVSFPSVRRPGKA